MDYDLNRNKLRQLRHLEQFYCPVCKEHVQLKIGEKRISHFAHVRDTRCSQLFEAETQEHLNGKIQLFEWLKKYYPFTTLESHIKEISQRPDILVNHNGKQYAIEFQCSQIPTSLFTKRTNAYKNVNIEPIWVLHEKWLKKDSQITMKMSPFQWQFVTQTNQTDSKIIYYNPAIMTFFISSPILPFSPTHVMSSFERSPLIDSNPQLLITSSISTLPLSDYKDKWLVYKRRLRMNLSYYSYKNEYALLKALYELRIAPSLIPAEVGIPVPSMIWIQTQVCFWQLWILIDGLLRMKIGESITFNQVYNRFSKRVKNRAILLRSFPLITTTSHPSFAIMEYLLQLSDLGILKRTGKSSFKKVKEFRIPSNDVEAEIFDRQILFSLCNE